MKFQPFIASLFFVAPLAFAAAQAATSQPADPKSASTQKYTPATESEIAISARIAELFTKSAEEKLEVKLKVIETDHFIIFTDWDPAEYGFLKRNLEEAYAVITKQFEIPVKENIFMGKLPVYMFAKQDKFKKFLSLYTSLRNPSDDIMGIHATRAIPLKNGTDFDFSFLVMWKPAPIKNINPNYSLANPKLQWAYTLAHELTHAFVHRYRSDARIPTWLNEGIAEVIANSTVPHPESLAAAKDYAKKNKPLDTIFEGKGLKDADQYPVMQTLVETLVVADKKAFLNLFAAVKDGTPVEEALQKYYKTDYKGLEAAWRRYLNSR